MIDTPVIFTTLGDAGGIGPELVGRSLAHPDATEGVRRLIVGPRAVFEAGMTLSKVETEVPIAESIAGALESDAPVILLDHNPTGLEARTLGASSAEAGASDLAVAELAVEMFRNGQIGGFVFAPVNKLSLKMAGSKFEGYKAYIADRLGERSSSAEINTIGDLWTTRVSSHVPISEVPSYVTKENVLEIIRYFDRELRRFGYSNPKIAVSGLNPHNGDGGMFGREEIDHIAPAVEKAKRYQLNVEGPYPPDTIFLTVKQEQFLGVVSMYHDQCQIATKLLGFDEGVTYFGGLPFPITTPAHGTAYDISGQGKASETPMVNALKLMRRAVLTAKGLPI
jgi:4-hydroxythreonine-4-phosphate dehydrogenase